MAEDKQMSIPPPTILQIEVTKKCNLSCTMCGKGSWRDHEEDTIQDYMLELLKPLYPNLRDAILFGDGEPFMYPRLWDLIEDIRKVNKTCHIGFITNGTALTERNIYKCFESDINGMGLSISGATREVHNKIRVGSDLDQIIDNFLLLKKLKKKFKKRRPGIGLTMVLMKDNYKQAPDVVKLAERLGATSLEFQKLHVPHSDVEKDRVDPMDLKPYLEIAKTVAIDLGWKSLDFNETPSFFVKPSRDKNSDRPQRYDTIDDNYSSYCPDQQAWNTMYILANGRVVPDCHWWGNDHLSEFKSLNSMGWLTKNTKSVLDEIWNGENYNKLRGYILSDIKLPQCSFCLGSDDPRIVNDRVLKRKQ